MGISELIGSRGNIAPVKGLDALPLVLSPTGVEALICFGVIRDLIVERRVHKVFLYALPILIVCQIAAMRHSSMLRRGG